MLFLVEFPANLVISTSACLCDPTGTAACNPASGECTCKINYTGDLCDTCVDGRYNPEGGCVPCECDPLNAQGTSCDMTTGQCSCIDSK